MKSWLKIFALFPALLLSLNGRVFSIEKTTAGSDTLIKVTFLPQWVPQAQFAGFYMAERKGFYEAEGLEVEILTGGPDKPGLQYLNEGRADFITTFLSAGIQNRAKGDKIVNIAQLSQKSAIMLVAKKARGIYKSQDLNGKKVGMWGSGDFHLLQKTFLKIHGIEMEIIPVQSSVNLFLFDAIDATSAMWYNEYHLIINSGINPDELTTFFFSETEDLNFPEDGIYCREDFQQKNPQICQAFTIASLKGWKYAFEHKEETVDVVMNIMDKAHVPANRPHQKWMLETMENLFEPLADSGKFGELNEASYYNVATVLKKMGLIDNIPDFNDFRKISPENDKK